MGIFNQLIPNAPFLYPLKTSENGKIYWYFQGVEKGNIRNKWVNLIITNLISNLIIYCLQKWLIGIEFNCFFAIHSENY